jgi:tryptophan synthase alpha chain
MAPPLRTVNRIMPNPLTAAIDKAGGQGRLALMPFVPAGFPSADSTTATLDALADAGADLIEVGVPFSDPIADGPIIQAAFNTALTQGYKVKDALAAVAARKNKSVPIVAMMSYSIVYRLDVATFCRDALDAGFSGLILPDLPMPHGLDSLKIIRDSGLSPVLLIAPTTAHDRRAEILKECRGFVYYLSVSGITGERSLLPADLPARVSELKTESRADLPVCVGFGISKPAHISELAAIRTPAGQYAVDGAIVGSAIVRAMTSVPPDQAPAAAAHLLRELAGASRRNPVT